MIHGINYISIIVVLVIFTAILTPIIIFNRRRERKLLQERIDERIKDGKDYADLTAKLNKGLYGVIKGEASSPIVLPVIAFAIILISWAMLLPKSWTKYWNHQEFFWISLVYLIVIFALGKLDKNWTVKWGLRTAFTIILLLYVRDELPKPPPGGDTSNKITTAQRIDSYGEWLVSVGPDRWSAEYCIPSGGTMDIKPVDPTIPFKYWLTFTDGSKGMLDIPAESKMGGKIFYLPDYKEVRIQAPEWTKVLIVTKP